MDPTTRFWIALRSPLDFILRARRCPFCIEPAPRLKRVAVQSPDPFDDVAEHYRCKACATEFAEDRQTGFLEPIHRDIRPTYHPAAHGRPPSSSANSPFNGIRNNSVWPSMRSEPAPNGLCRQCNHHQEIMIHLILSYDDLSTIDDYRQELETRYPLCQACQHAVAERLKRVAYQAKAKSIHANWMKPQDSSARISFLSIGFRTLCFLSFALMSTNSIDHRYRAGVTGTLLILTAMLKYWRHSVLSIILLLSLHLDCFIWETSLGCALLSVFLTTTTAIPKAKVNFIEPARPASRAADLTASLDKSFSMGAPLGSENTAPRNRSIFEPPSLPPKPPAAPCPNVSTRLRPTMLDPSQNLGIESRMGSFSLEDTRDAASSTVSIYPLLFLKIGLSVVRFLIANEQLVALLYALNFYFAAQFFRHGGSALASMARSFCACRLAWLAAECFGGFTVTPSASSFPSHLFDTLDASEVWRWSKVGIDCFLLLLS